MSRSNKNIQIQTDDVPYKEIPEADRYYIGRNKAGVQVSVQKPDKYEYDRWQASRKLSKPEWDLEDEPDDDRFNLREKELL